MYSDIDIIIGWLKKIKIKKNVKKKMLKKEKVSYIYLLLKSKLSVIIIIMIKKYDQSYLIVLNK